MSTTLLNAAIAVLKDIGDYFSGTTTGAGSATTMVDASLMAKANDWITDNAHVMLTEEPASSAAIYDERKVSSLDNATGSTGTLTTLTFAAAPGTGIDYLLTRLFSPSDVRIALISGAKTGFPHIHNKVRNESKRAGNWLKDGSVESWSSSSALNYWTASVTTLAQTSTTRLFMNGSYSCKLSTGAGYVGQSIANNDDLKFLRGKAVKFYARGWCDTASALRLAVYDGTTTTYSSYHPGDSAWDNEDDHWYVDADISPTATEVAFRVYLDNAAAIGYVDDMRVISGEYPRVYIGDLDLAQDHPRRVSYFPIDYSLTEPIPIHDYEIDTDWLYLKANYNDCLLRIEGTGYLDFLASGVASTAWTATIALDEPQLKILSAEAAIYLYSQMAANYSGGSYQYAIERLQYWQVERERRINQFGMHKAPATVRWNS